VVIVARVEDQVSSIVGDPTSPAPQDSTTLLGEGQMAFKSISVGRMEKRLPIAIVVRLAHAEDQLVDGAELTYTDNVSAHGARVISRRAWQSGEVVMITSLKDETTIRGKVIYCQKLPDDRYCIGLNFQDRRVTWSAYRAYNSA
jgi:hypothetical protein